MKKIFSFLCLFMAIVAMSSCSSAKEEKGTSGTGNAALDNIFERKSVRTYLNKGVEKETLSFSSLYTNPLVLNNFFTGRPLRGIHAFNSSTVGFSSTIKRLVNSMLFSVNHFLAFWHVLHAGYCKNNVAIFIYNLILDI